MDDSKDTNQAIWHSGEAVQAWAAEAQVQERYRTGHRRFMAALLPFSPREAFTFLDLGAGTGAASRTVLDLHPGSTAILADFSAEMMRAGEHEMEPYAGRYRYVEFDMAAGGTWPAAIPAAVDAVVTSMCVHHLPDERKQGLFTEIFDRLAPGGADSRMECRPGGDSSGRRGHAPRVFDEVSPIQLIAHVVLLGSRVPRNPGRKKRASLSLRF